MRDERTLGQAAHTDSTWFEVECQNHSGGAGCYHERKFGIIHAIVLWGPERQLEALRFVCSFCGARVFRLNFRTPLDAGGSSKASAIEYHAMMYRYHWRHLWRHGYNIRIV